MKNLKGMTVEVLRPAGHPKQESRTLSNNFDKVTLIVDHPDFPKRDEWTEDAPPYRLVWRYPEGRERPGNFLIAVRINPDTGQDIRPRPFSGNFLHSWNGIVNDPIRAIDPEMKGIVVIPIYDHVDGY